MAEEKTYTLEELKKKLTKKERIFCHQYIIDWNAARAAREAGYSEKTANEIGSEVSKKQHIKQYIGFIYPEYKNKKDVTRANSIKNNVGYVYLIKCKGLHYYKIGKSVNGGDQRLLFMQTGIPFDLELILNIKCHYCNRREKELHFEYKNYLVRGEWFVFSDVILDEVKSKIKSYGST